MNDELAFTYDASKNPGGAVLDGVPLRDLTAAEFNKLAKKWQKAVEREPFYVPVIKKATKTEKGD